MWDSIKTFYLYLSKDFDASVPFGLCLIAFSMICFFTGSIGDDNDNEYTGRELNIICSGLVITGLISMISGFIGFIAFIAVMYLPEILDW
jgi:hypothetical protein